MAKYLKTLRYMIKQGYQRDKALLALSRAYALTPEYIAELDRRTK